MGVINRKKEEFVMGSLSIRTVDGSVIKGKINLGGNERVSDALLTEDSPYLVVFEASSSSVDGKVFIVNKEHIIWVEPED
jgi:hypothetical protein